MGYSEVYLVKAEDPDLALASSLKLFQEVHDKHTAEAFELHDGSGGLIDHGLVTY